MLYLTITNAHRDSAKRYIGTELLLIKLFNITMPSFGKKYINNISDTLYH